jgi:hypothetical protein
VRRDGWNVCCGHLHTLAAALPAEAQKHVTGYGNHLLDAVARNLRALCGAGAELAIAGTRNPTTKAVVDILHLTWPARNFHGRQE